MKFVQPIRDREILERFKSYLGDQSPRNRLLFVTGVHTGLRISDILKLRVRDVQGDYIDIKETKTGKNVRRLVSSTLRKELDAYIRNKDGRVFLFRSRLGSNQPLTRSGAYKMLRKAAEAVGIDNMGTHTLRKTFGYHLYKKEKNVAKLQALLNHSKPEITMRYIGVTQDELDDSMRDFDL